MHNIIRVRMDSAEGELLVGLIDTPEFQRLRRVRQLGLAHFAYQGAEHSRFTHSLGVFHLATRVLAKLSNSYDISDEDRIAVRVATLLHDVGHGAFSHVIESILGFHHEDFTVETVLAENTGIGRLLKEYSADLPKRVADIIRGDFRPMALSQLVSSQLDVDRMDYLLRDSMMTGVKYGVFDLEWIIKSLEINEKDDHLYISAPGIYAVEDYLQARYYMYRQVYFHRTLRAAEAVLHSLLRRALKLHADGKYVWHVKDTPVESILRAERLSLDQHLALDDSDVLFHIKRWQDADDKVLADLAHRFLNRKLLKAFDLDMPEEERAEFIDDVRKVVGNAGLDPDYYVLEDRAGDVAHNFYVKDDSRPKEQIYVEHGFAKPRINEISEVSAAVRGLQKGYRIHRVCFPYELMHEIDKIYHA
ncbi:MAG: HD domain-containing protein [Acidobacteria bacterium]|nr:HD domain-containing protein [Acidobacteriota bacterium]